MSIITVRQLPEFASWLSSLRDASTKAVIAARIKRVERGNLGDVKSVGEGVSELRIDFGPGWRLYFKQVGLTVVVLLVGGSKSSQDGDIARAKHLAAQLDQQ